VKKYTQNVESGALIQKTLKANKESMVSHQRGVPEYHPILSTAKRIAFSVGLW